MSDAPTDSSRNTSYLEPELAFSQTIEAIYAFATIADNVDDLFDLIQIVDHGAAEDTPFAAALKRHLERAETIAERVEDSAPDQEQNFGIVLLDSARCILSLNEKATDLLAGRSSPLVKGSKHTMLDPETDQGFKEAFDALPAQQIALVRLHDKAHETMQLAFLVSAPLASDLAPKGDASGPIHAALLLPNDLPKLGETLQPETLGLTPAESKLAQTLQDGISLKEAASRIGIAHNTARNQLQSLFTKLGSRRQAELMRNLDALALLHQTIADKKSHTIKPEPGFDYPAHRSIKLEDGRTLAWREYGAPDGFPVLMLPSVLATSYIPKIEADAFNRKKLRLFCIERPGRGLSTFDPLGTPQSVARDIKSFCDRMELESISILGSASGCPFAVAAAIHMGSQVKAMGLLAPRLFYNADSGMAGSIPALFYGTAARRPSAARHVINIMKGRATRALASLMIHRMYKDQPADKKLLETRPDLFEALLTSGVDAFSMQPEGIVRELSVLKGGNQLDYTQLTCKVLTWRGDGDNHFPKEDFDEVTQSFPFSSVRTFENSGHLIFNQHTDDILSDLRAASLD